MLLKSDFFWQDINSSYLNLSISVIYIECLVLNVILSICTMQFFHTIVILIDFEMKQANN